MNPKLTSIISGALLLTLGSGLAFAIEPRTEIGKHIKALLSEHSCHECVLNAITMSHYIEKINKTYHPDTDNQQARYEISMLFVESGNPTNALRCASGLTDLNKKYEIAEALIKSGNPRNGVQCLESMPEEYIIKGINLLEQTGNPGNARILRDYLSD